MCVCVCVCVCVFIFIQPPICQNGLSDSIVMHIHYNNAKPQSTHIIHLLKTNTHTGNVWFSKYCLCSEELFMFNVILYYFRKMNCIYSFLLILNLFIEHHWRKPDFPPNWETQTRILEEFIFALKELTLEMPNNTMFLAIFPFSFLLNIIKNSSELTVNQQG